MQTQLKQRDDKFHDGEYYKKHWGYGEHKTRGMSPGNKAGETQGEEAE